MFEGNCKLPSDLVLYNNRQTDNQSILRMILVHFNPYTVVTIYSDKVKVIQFATYCLQLAILIEMSTTNPSQTFTRVVAVVVEIVGARYLRRCVPS